MQGDTTMKRTTRLLSFLIVMVMLISSVSVSVSAVSNALKGKTIVALGDSMTRFGTTSSGGTSSTGEKTYPYYMGTNEYLGVPVINAGVGGDTTNHAMARFKTDVLDKNPDVVIICLGMNDQAMVISSEQPNIPLETYRSNLDYFAKQLKAIGSDVVFVTPSPVNSNTGYYVPGGYGLDYSSDFMLDFCNAMREVAIDNECTLVDINYECAFEDMNKFAQVGDGIHHSDYGRKQYAKYISEHLEAVYDGTSKATMTVKCVDEKGNTLKTVTHVGKAGAHITLASPMIEGYKTDDADIKTTFVNGNTFTFTYSVEIYDLIEKAKTLSAYDYSNSIIDLLRKEVQNAEVLANKAGVTSAELVACANKLKTLFNSKEAYIVSQGASYTTTAPNRGTAHDDDKIRLTDGVKGTPDGGSSRYSGWNGNTVTVDIDLGAVYKVNSFSAYSVWGDWGIEKPDSITVSVSDDGKTYKEVASQTDCKIDLVTASWSTSVLTAVTEDIIQTRYVRFTVNSKRGFIWLGEVEAALRTVPEENRIYVNKINDKVLSGDSIVFTPAFGKITGDTANHMWTSNVIAKWDAEKNAYVVKSVSQGSGDSTPDIELASDEILIATHSDEVSANCIKNKAKAAALTVGQTIVLSGISAEDASLDVAPYIEINGYKEEQPLSNGKNFFVSHFNDITVEGAGVIFTKEYTGCAWWTHVSFKPVEGLDGVYEIVEIIKGASNGSGKPLAIPKGGFVWAGNNGNDYPSLYAKDNTQTGYKNKPNYTNQAIKTMLSAVNGWKTGDRFVFSGLDLLSLEVPTETPYIDWYQPTYVNSALFAPYIAPHDHIEGEWKTLTDGSQELRCTVCGELLDTKPAPSVETETYALGDINMDGAVNQYDYILAKRAHFNTITFNENQKVLGDMNEDGKNDQYDYILVKRIHFKNYSTDKTVEIVVE